MLQDIPAGQVHEFQVHRPGKKPLLYELKLGDEVMQAPMVIVCSMVNRDIRLILSLVSRLCKLVPSEDH